MWKEIVEQQEYHYSQEANKHVLWKECNKAGSCILRIEDILVNGSFMSDTSQMDNLSDSSVHNM